MDLRTAFEPTGVTAVVGAGGKKSTLYALAAELERAVLTATVRIPPFEDRVERLEVTEDPIGTVRGNGTWPLGVVPGRDGVRDRYLGYDTDRIDELAATTDVPILTKADGARTRWIKAPAEEEPQVPAAADLVVPVASVRAVGERIDEEHVHRPERLASLLDRPPGSRIRPVDVAAVLGDQRGGLKDVPADARVVPLVNMVDDGELRAVAEGIAEELLAVERIGRVVLGRMDRGEVVGVLQ
ncbi:putative selenium-dependent hydroxylase accessory protein YqeC [Natronomonas sp. F2-12]|jgi:probable selenium-dependent hydroxylase accessory protein YqeC|uniref:Selenium-dependent hydroxylase accessory protein YqeC n=1 Tax=Natronomonas aquatica TaxID=2841590 RepID=A0A9R1D571_9EURY|nr:selenium cofactor biosynthesis protein YqeC [Natronomonas aquatica]MCQ4332771.1 putative selenium-dependent hydroxylase accessory protein YqeC [Natronomonas aquatica]